MKKFFLLSLWFLCYCRGFAQQDSADYFRSFDSTKIHYEVLGNGFPVLLIHGFTGNGANWKNSPLQDSLLLNGFKVITVDLRGNGLSDKPLKAESYANDAEAKDLIALMKFLGLKKYFALGYSRGSIILARVLVKDSNCKRAVIGGMGADFTNPEWPRRIGFYNALMNDSIKGYEDFRKYIAKKGLDPLVLAYQQKEQPSTSKEELSKLALPVMIICGDQDEDNGSASALQQLIHNSIFETVPGNHNNSSGSPAFAGKVLHFFKEK